MSFIFLLIRKHKNSFSNWNSLDLFFNFILLSWLLIESKSCRYSRILLFIINLKKKNYGSLKVKEYFFFMYKLKDYPFIHIQWASITIIFKELTDWNHHGRYEIFRYMCSKLHRKVFNILLIGLNKINDVRRYMCSEEHNE